MKKSVYGLMVCVALVSTPAYAQVSFSQWLKSLFVKDNTPKPEETLVAPFADPGVAQQEGPKAQVPSASLRVPHRAAHDIGIWVVTSVSNALSFRATDPQNVLNSKHVYFNDEGYTQYLAFMKQFSVLSPIDGQAYDIQSFVPQDPVLLNEGEISGTYRWLFELPVMVTYEQPGMQDYKGARPTVKSYMIRVQVGRVPKGADEEGILIESWDGRLVKGSN